MNVSSFGIDGLDEAVQQVISNVKSVWKQYQGQEPIWDVIMAFIHAVDWKVSVQRWRWCAMHEPQDPRR